ncbi:MAG: hypothetical protein MO852_03215 [Candidatus Devosia euplotis]|nr:hypothetical protein [Candidatus Devosia euplotis]
MLDGTVDPAVLAGKQVLIGASAIELRDFFRVPRFGVLDSGMVQIAATETLKAGYALSDLGFLPSGLLGLLVIFAIMAARRRFSAPQLAVATLLVSLGVEIAAWLALSLDAVLVDTALFQIMVGGSLP